MLVEYARRVCSSSKLIEYVCSSSKLVEYACRGSLASRHTERLPVWVARARAPSGAPCGTVRIRVGSELATVRLSNARHGPSRSVGPCEPWCEPSQGRRVGARGPGRGRRPSIVTIHGCALWGVYRCMLCAQWQMCERIAPNADACWTRRRRRMMGRRGMGCVCGLSRCQ